MSDLNKKKLEKEIELLEHEKKDKDKRFCLDVLKFISSISGAIILFYFIQHPSSILSQKRTTEDILRERSKLLLEIVKEEDPEIKNLSLETLKSIYKIEKENNWISKMEQYIQKEANIEITKKLLKKYIDLEAKNSTLKREREVLVSKTDRKIITNQINLITSEMDHILTRLDKLQAEIDILLEQ